MPMRPATIAFRNFLRTSRSVGLTFAAASVLFVAGCGLFSDGPRDQYAMSRISGRALPAVLTSDSVVGDPRGGRVEYVLVSGSLKLYGGSRFELEGVLHEVWDGSGVVTEVFSRRDRGSYERSDSEIVIRFTDIEGRNRVFTYGIFEGGRIVRGVQWEREAEYVKQ